jgi:hypothetical protein
MQGFATDSGNFAVTQGVLQVTAASSNGDAVAVWYSDAYQTVYYELAARISMVKPTGGWKANSYIIFDYFSPTDFKFAGIDQSINKMVIGNRDATGWHVLAQGVVNGGVKAATWYDLNVIVNGLVVTVTANGANAFSYTFAPRVIGGDQVALNKGLAGFGSQQAKGSIDNLALTVIAPAITIDRTDYFEVPNPTTKIVTDTTVTGTFTRTSTGRFEGIATGGVAAALMGVTTGSPAAVPTFDELSYVELEANFRAAGTTGFMFDWYSPTDYKFVALDVAGQRVIVGHVIGASRVVDQAIARTITAGSDYLLNIVLKATVVTVTLSGQVLASVTYNAPLADGRQGVFGLGAGTVVSINDYRLKTDDPVYTAATAPQQTVSISDASVTEGAAGTTKTVTLTVTRSSSTDPLTMAWSIDPSMSTATNGTDYTGPTSGTVYFAPGQTTATITFTIKGDATVEPNEQFVVRLQENALANISDATGTVTIVNDD